MVELRICTRCVILYIVSLPAERLTIESAAGNKPPLLCRLEHCIGRPG